MALGDAMKFARLELVVAPLLATAGVLTAHAQPIQQSPMDTITPKEQGAMPLAESGCTISLAEMEAFRNSRRLIKYCPAGQ